MRQQLKHFRKHPPHLKGKEIGLYYAKKGKISIKEKKKENTDIKDKLDRHDDEYRGAPKNGSSGDLFFAKYPEAQGLLLWTHCKGIGWRGVEDDHSRKMEKDIFVVLSQQLQVSIQHQFQKHIQNILSKATPQTENKLLHSECQSNKNSFKTEYNKMIFENSVNHTVEPECLRYSFVPNKLLDHYLQDKLVINQACNKNIQKLRKKLPVFTFKQTCFPSYNELNYILQKIIDTLNKNRIVVISGETGSGKTTQIAQFILDDYIKNGKGSLCSIACTQPRRISATSVAHRVAKERGETCGDPDSCVGYKIRLDSKQPRSQGSILFCTPGIILQEMRTEKFLSKYSHIILDEVHERDINTDFLIIILRDLLEKRPDLHLVLMSATLNAERFSNYFWNCSMINIPGYTYPVEEFFLEDVIEECSFLPSISKSAKQNNLPKYFKYTRKGQEKLKEFAEDKKMTIYFNSLAGIYSSNTIEALHKMDLKILPIDLIVHLIKHICNSKNEGGILVFMTGWKSIEELHKKLSGDSQFNSGNSMILPLHSMMPTVNQEEIFKRPREGVRKIIIATNIAETSITIEDIVYVIDCGKVRISNFDDENNLSTLNEEWISLANAKQRKGRAGRVQPGICYHTYTKMQHDRLEDYPLPEMLRTRHEEVCLRIKNLKLGKIKTFLTKAMDPPSSNSIDLSIRCLENLQALDEKENLTPLGFHLSKLPVNPQIGKMILMASIFSCIDPILTVAASISFKEAFVIPLGKEHLVDKRKQVLANGTKSDHIAFINAVKGWENSKSNKEAYEYAYFNFLSTSTLNLLVDLKKQFAEYLVDLKFLKSSDVKFPEANKNSSELPKLKTKDEIVKLHPKSVNHLEPYFDSQLLVYYKKIKSTCVFIHDSTMVTPFQLLFFGGKIDLIMDNHDELVTIDNWVSFKIQHSQALLMQDLRKNLDNFLEYKINNPGVTSWNSNENYYPILCAIVDLISSQNWK
ncbi:ATP-dependent RNA helicase DHX36 [Nymphon striatum]|nr:ATP-dependent RNA helicase DHX36 [Nymphon striatum]